MTRRLASIVCVVAVAGSMVGCEAFSFMDDDADAPPSTGAVDYADLATRYNRRTGRIASIYARASVELDFINAEGKAQWEQGEGHFMYRRPLDLALSVGKLGEIMFWIGGDRERYWWLELRPGGDAPKTAYVGRHDERIGLDDGAGPLPVGPDELLALMGLVPIAGPEESHPVAGSVDNGTRAVVTAYLGAAKGAPPMRQTVVDIATARPTEVKVIDADGEAVVVSKLSKYEPMAVHGKPPGDWPWLPTRIELSVPKRQARMVLFLSDMTDGKEHNKIKDAQFDFEKLTKLLGVERVRVIRPRERAVVPPARPQQP